MLLALTGTAGWVGAWLLQDGSLARVQQARTLRVGYAVEAPYAWVGAGGLVTGESPALARSVAEAAGLPPIEWVQTTFDQLIPGLRARRFDVVAAGLFITPERTRLVQFSQAVLCVRPGWLLPRGNPAGLLDYAPQAGPGAVPLAVLSGSVEHQLFRQHGALVVVPDALAGRVAVQRGLAQGLALSLPTVRELARERPDLLEAQAAQAQPGPCGPLDSRTAFAFHPEDRTLREHWDAALERQLGRPAHLAQLARFGFGEDDLPPENRLVQPLADPP